MMGKSAEEKQWMIFLCYAREVSEDIPFVDWLYGRLSNANLNLKVWYEKYEILVGDPEFPRMYEGLERSDFLIVVVSRWTQDSDWVKAALGNTITRQTKGQQVIVLPLVLDKTPYRILCNDLK